MDKNIKVVVVGAGNMGAAHARAYKYLDGFDLVGLVAPTPARRHQLAAELGEIAEFNSLDQALEETAPDAIAICSYPDTHYSYALQSLNYGAHIFLEKPIAETVEQAEKIVNLAKSRNKKIVIGYILRHHPAWIKFIEQAQTLGKPLVMRMNLNQQSSSKQWFTHKQLMKSMSPIVDCGVHYVDVMCQMTKSKPKQVQAIGVNLSDEIAADMYNYGQLQVLFRDGSVGWYEAAWGPMISETANFVKDVIGPQGSISIVDPNAMGQVDSSNIDQHTKTNSLRVHKSQLDTKGDFAYKDIILDTKNEPDHQELCNREQLFFQKAINDDLDLSEHLDDAIDSLKIVLAADESVRTGKVVYFEE